MRTAHKAIAIAIAAAFTLSACGTSSTSPTPATMTATTPTPTLAEGWVTPTKDNPFGIDWATQTPFTGPATDKFGAVNVMAAYREAVNFSLQQGYSDLMAKGYEARAIEFSVVKPYLTPAARTIWDGYVKAALAGDTSAGGSVYALTLWDAADGPYEFRPGQLHYADGVAFSAAKTAVETVDGTDYLSMQFTVTRNVRVTDGKTAVLLPLTRDVTYQLTPTGAKAGIPWLINSWATTRTWGVPEVDPQGATP